jgi:hypothetical protein
MFRIALLPELPPELAAWPDDEPELQLDRRITPVRSGTQAAMSREDLMGVSAFTVMSRDR